MLPFEDYFDGLGSDTEILSDGATVLRNFARKQAPALIETVLKIVEQVPFRDMTTPGGYKMSLRSSGCGDLGWLSQQHGFDYAAYGVRTGRKLPPMPPRFLDLAKSAAETAGYPGFQPDTCLINQYVPGASLGLHQDREECDFAAPIVSVSLGLAIIFLFGGLNRNDPVRPIPLDHGDVVVWGGASRLAFHGVRKLKEGYHPLVGRQRINLTFRKTK